MVKNRLMELQQEAGVPLKPDDESVDIDSDMNPDQAEKRETFHKKVDLIRDEIATVERNIENIAEKHGQALAAISEKQGQMRNEELDQVMGEISRSANRVRKELKLMDSEIKAIPEDQAGTADTRMMKQQHSTLSRKFVEVMTEYNDVQTKYKQKYRDRVKRQFKIVKPDATEAEIDDVLDNEKGNTIFAQQMLSQHHAEAQQALEDIQDRHKDLIKLEKSIRELHELFVDMAILVEQQGEMVDRIEFNVTQSTDYVEQAVVELKEAQQYQSSARKKQIIFASIVIVIIVIIVIILILQFK